MIDKDNNITGIRRGYLTPAVARVRVWDRMTMWLAWSPFIINSALVALWVVLALIVLALSLCRHVIGGDLGWPLVMEVVSGLKWVTLAVEAIIIVGTMLFGAWLLSASSRYGRDFFLLTSIRRFVINSVMTKHLHISARDEREDTISLR